MNQDSPQGPRVNLITSLKILFTNIVTFWGPEG